MTSEELSQIAKNTPTVAFHKFILLSNNKKKDLFCFFEGNDSPYYSLRIKHFFGKNYHPIKCGNKNAVLKVFDLISKNNEYKNFKTAYFIDKDFDIPIQNDSIYETSCYSIENFYANKSLISELLKNEMNLTEIDDTYKIIIDTFEQQLKLFSNETLYFNGWYCALKRKKKIENLSSTLVSLDEKLPKNFICLKIGEIKSNYDFQKIKDTFPDALEITENEINLAISDLKIGELAENLRGKFQMWFLQTFIQYLIDDSLGSKSLIPKKTKFRLDKSNTLSQLSQYASTCENLEKYIQTFR